MKNLQAITRHLTDAWYLAKPFWLKHKFGLPAILLVLLVTLNLASIQVLSYFASWNGDFYNALQNYDSKQFIHLLYTFSLIIAAYLPILLTMSIIRKYIELTWRMFLSNHYQNMWLAQHNHYKFNIINNHTIDNPDQRISDDINGFIILSLDFILGLIRSVFMLIVFIPMLWHLSGSYTFNWHGNSYNINGFMLYVLLIYVLLATILQIKIGKPLIGLYYNEQALEAEFRYSLIRIREYSENIALYNGEESENNNLRAKLSKVITNSYAILKQQIKLDIFGFSYGQINSIFPILVMAPQYFAKKITLGAMMQTKYSFSRVLDSLSFVINIYSGTLVGLRVIMTRLLEFQKMTIYANDLQNNSRLNKKYISTGLLTINKLNIYTKSQKYILQVPRLDIKISDRMLISGASGSGKTTLFKVLANMWPYADGDIIMSNNLRYFFVAQRSYLSIDSIYNILIYSNLNKDLEEVTVINLLKKFNLEKLTAKLYVENNYMQELSLGEVQSLMIIRAILSNPDVLFLDEATNSMDHITKNISYSLLHQYLPNCTIITIAHDQELQQYHNIFYKIKNGALHGT